MRSCSVKLCLLHVCLLYFKTLFNNFNNLILLLSSHLVITRQAQTSLKNVHAHMLITTFDIGIGFGSAIAFSCDKRIHSEDRLFVHRLPDWTTFCIVLRQGFQNLCRAALARFADTTVLLPGSRLTTCVPFRHPT